MRRIWWAIKIFFLTLLNRAVAGEVERILLSRQEPQPEPKPLQQPKTATALIPKAPARSEALTLLATLQREARLLDFIMEPLAGYNDAQIGAVARDVHRDCGKVIERLFAPKPAASSPEGAEIEVPAGFDAMRYRLVGNVGASPPLRGKLIHPGWEAARCELPAWSGSAATVRIIAPIEVEVL
jgi:hypothetical protein